MGDAFRLQSKKIHLTFKHHIAFDKLRELILNVIGPRELKWYSYVHEQGHQESETPYDHTHAAFEVNKALNIRNPRAFDINHEGEDVHPHIKRIETNEHACSIFYEYHRKEPVQLEQSGNGPVGGQRGGKSLFEQVRTAPTLEKAMEAAGVGIKSVADVQAIRNDKRTRHEHKYRDANWTRSLVHNFRCMYIYGQSGTGKTQWALHCFRNPLLVSEYDDLRNFVAGDHADAHDGIVFDDMRFSGKDNSWLVNILTWEESLSVSIRYHTVTIPKGTRKIFTSNYQIGKTFPQVETTYHAEEWQREEWGKTSPEILRRLTLNGAPASNANLPQIIHIKEKTFIAEEPPNNCFVVGRGIKRPRAWWEPIEEEEGREIPIPVQQQLEGSEESIEEDGRSRDSLFGLERGDTFRSEETFMEIPLVDGQRGGGGGGKSRRLRGGGSERGSGYGLSQDSTLSQLAYSVSTLIDFANEYDENWEDLQDA